MRPVIIGVLVALLLVGVCAWAQEHKPSWAAGKIPLDGKAVFSYKNPSWEVYEAVYSPGKTHILVNGVSKMEGARPLRSFDVLVLKPQGEGFVAKQCAIVQDINFDLLDMSEARWEGDGKIVVRANPMQWDKKSGKMIPSEKTVVEHFDVGEEIRRSGHM